MADDPDKSGNPDRSRISGDEDYEIAHFARNNVMPVAQRRALIRQHGNCPETLEPEAPNPATPAPSPPRAEAQAAVCPQLSVQVQMPSDGTAIFAVDSWPRIETPVQYNWQCTGGLIVSGQHTYAITVTAPDNEVIIPMVIVLGLPDGCQCAAALAWPMPPQPQPPAQEQVMTEALPPRAEAQDAVCPQLGIEAQIPSDGTVIFTITSWPPLQGEIGITGRVRAARSCPTRTRRRSRSPLPITRTSSHWSACRVCPRAARSQRASCG